MPDRVPSAVDQFIAAVEGAALPAGAGRNGTVICDNCDEPLPTGTPSTHYVTNNLITSTDEEKSGLGFLRAYCPACSVGHLRYPCQGYTELLVEATLTDDGRFADVDILDHSSRHRGVAWDPIELYNAVHEYTLTEFQQTAQQATGAEIALGPEDVVCELELAGVDIEELVEDDGQLRTNSEVLRNARTKVTSQMQT